MAESFTVDKMRQDPSDSDLIIGKKITQISFGYTLEGGKFETVIGLLYYFIVHFIRVHKLSKSAWVVAPPPSS